MEEVRGLDTGGGNWQPEKVDLVDGYQGPGLGGPCQAPREGWGSRRFLDQHGGAWHLTAAALASPSSSSRPRAWYAPLRAVSREAGGGRLLIGEMATNRGVNACPTESALGDGQGGSAPCCSSRSLASGLADGLLVRGSGRSHPVVQPDSFKLLDGHGSGFACSRRLSRITEGEFVAVDGSSG